MDRAFLLQVLAIALGGGAIQLLIFLLRRRAELRSLDRSGEAKMLTGASDFMAKISAEREGDRAEMERLRRLVVATEDRCRADIESLRSERVSERNNLVRRLNQANSENSHLQSLVAQLRTELNIAQRQIRNLEDLLGRQKPS